MIEMLIKKSDGKYFELPDRIYVEIFNILTKCQSLGIMPELERSYDARRNGEGLKMIHAKNSEKTQFYAVEKINI